MVEGIDHRLADQPDAALGAPFDDEVLALDQVEPEVGGAELAVLVEDAYQRTGLGLVVVCAALVEVARSGVPRAAGTPPRSAARAALGRASSRDRATDTELLG